MNLNEVLLPQIVHCLFSGSIDSVLREDKGFKGLNRI